MKKKFSIRKQLLTILIVFIVVALGLIYFFQTTLLDDFYKNNKIETIKKTANDIVNNLDNDDLNNILDVETFSNEVCVRIVSESIYLVDYENRICALNQLTDYQLLRIYSEVKENNNEKLFDNYRFQGRPGELQDIYIYGIIGTIDDQEALVLVSSNIVPLDVTINTISDQFILIALIVILMTIVLAFVLSFIIVKPIKQIESETKQLPKGKYNEDNIKANNLEIDNLNNTLAKANEEIKKADKAKKELIGNVSHDLRTPLTMIVGYGEMIRDFKEENNEDNINVIIDEAKRLSTLVDDLLDVSKIESGAIELNKEDISLNELLKDVYKQYENYCKNQKVKFKLQLNDDKTINVDSHRIKQVLYNFINNALNYNDKKKKEIILGTEINDSFTRVFVYDNGVGIKKEDLDNIWDRYYKVDKEHKRVHLGSGIGLSLSRDLLIAHDLKYGVESLEGEYSKFYFDI